MGLLLLGCGGKEAPAPLRSGTVLIQRFEASPPAVRPGQAVRLMAEFPAGHGQVEPEVGPVHPKVAVVVHPREDTTYTLTVRVGEHSAKATVQVKVAHEGARD